MSKLRRPILEVRARLGTRSDCWIARWSGLPRSTVRRMRVTGGIPAYTTGYQEQIEKNRSRLGMVPDTTIADEIGCCTETVRSWRAERGIAAYTRTRNGQ